MQGAMIPKMSLQQYCKFQISSSSGCSRGPSLPAGYLSVSPTPYYSVRNKGNVCRQKAIYCPWHLLPTLPFPCPKAPSSGSCSPVFGLHGALSGPSHILRVLGLQSHQPISLGCQRGRVLTYKAQRKGKAGVPWDAYQDSSRTDAQSWAPGSTCPGQTHRAFAAAPGAPDELVFANGGAPLGTASLHLLPWLLALALGLPRAWGPVQAGGCWAG